LGGEAPRTPFGTKFVFASTTAWLWRVRRQINNHRNMHIAMLL